MKPIKFDEKTISEIREYAKTHTKTECCNRFSIKIDVMHRVAKENNILFNGREPYRSVIPEDITEQICNLFENTDTSLHEIAKSFHIKYTRLVDFLIDKYSQKVFDDRKRRLYQKSKLGENNPMLGKTGEQHPNYVGLVEDGNGYFMCLKPDWYTGRKGSKHVFYHSVVVCEALGLTEIPKGFVVHHIDGNKKNNDISNLALLSTSAHSKLHAIERRMSKVQRLGDTVGSNPETPDND